MPELDQLLDRLVADVTAGTRPPGAAAAIKQVRRRRVTVAGAGAVAVVAAGGLLAGTLGSVDRSAPAGPSQIAPSESATAQDSPEWPASTRVALGRELDQILAQVPGWTVGVGSGATGWDYAYNGRCAGNWTKGATSGGDGGVSTQSHAGLGHAGWPTAERAADATTTFIADLTSCDTTAWRTQPIGPPGAVLASSDTAVTWIQQTRGDVWVLQVPTADGPPPADVQLQVLEWLDEYTALQNED